MVDFVLDEEVEQRHDCRKESGGKYLPVLDRFGIRRAEFDAADGPGDGSQEVRDHEDVMPIVIIRGRNICPAAASECPKYANSRYPLWQGIAFPRGHHIPQRNQGESWTGCHGNEYLKHGSLGITVANGRRDRGKPLLWVAVVLVLDDFGEVQQAADSESTEEGTVCQDGMSPRHPSCIELQVPS